MDALTREQILASTLAFEDVEVPAWGRTVRIRELTQGERDFLEVEVLRDKATGGNLRARLLVRCCTDPETGACIFAAGDAALLGKTSAKVVQQLFEVGSRISGLTEDEMEEMGKASAAPAGSPFSSPASSG